MKKLLLWLLSIMVLAAMTGAIFAYVFSQRYVQDSPTTATTGIFFKTTLNLEEYNNVSSGNAWLGKFDRYSRSDRHTEVITVYCKTYCKK